MKQRIASISALILAIALTVWLAIPMRAATSTLTGTIVDAQGNPLNGSLTMQLPVPAQDTATNTAVMNTLVRYKVVNGVIQSGPPLYDVVGLQPTNLYYITKVYDSANNLVMFGNYVVTGASFNLGAATPTSITTSNISFLNPASLTGNNVFSGANTFTQPITESVSTGTAPFNITSTTVVPNLNVNVLNGVTVSGAASANSFLQATSSSAAGWTTPTGLQSFFVNAAVTGTTLNLVAKLNATGGVVTTATTDTGGALGICLTNCGTTGSAGITTTGTANCTFDGATVVGDYVQISATVAGNCHDAGASYPGNGQVLGRVLSTNGAGGTYNIVLFGTEIRGATPSVTGAIFINKNLAGNVGILASTLTTIDSIAVTMPASGGPWRVLITYTYYNNGGVNVSCFVTDATNKWAAWSQNTSNNVTDCIGSQWSPTTYANGANVTFTVKEFNTGATTATTTDVNAQGAPSSMQVMVVSSN